MMEKWFLGENFQRKVFKYGPNDAQWMSYVLYFDLCDYEG